MGEVLCGRCELGYARVPRDGRCHACGCPITSASPEVSEAEVERAAVAIYEAHAAQYPRPKWLLPKWAELDDPTRRHWTAVATGSIAALTAARGGAR